MSKHLSTSSLFYIVLSILLLPMTRSAYTQSTDKPILFVSIAPQKYFIEQIAKDTFNVQVMIPKGHNPAHYEPSIKQMQHLSKSTYYFRIGMPFESVWIDRLARQNPQLQVIDIPKGIHLLPLESHSKHNHSIHTTLDPHIWTDPLLVIAISKNILQHLTLLLPQHKAFFQQNFQSFKQRLLDLDQYLGTQLQPLKDTSFLVFHPSWGYFAKRYQLQQVAIELQGKSPTPRYLANIIQYATYHHIRVIFVQPQFNQSIAKNIARTIPAHIITIDPLAENYIDNMYTVADALLHALKK